MKKLLTIPFLLFSIIAFAQDFEGTVSMDISYDLPADQQSMASMMPKNQVFQIKGDKSRMEQNVMGVSSIIIRDNTIGQSTILMEMQGMKYKFSVKDDQKDETNTKVEMLDGTKEILGYTCHKAKVTVESEQGSSEMTVYYTKELPAPKMKGMEKIEGFPLEYEMRSQGMTMQIVTKEVKKESIDASLFVIPEGYEEMPANLKAMMGMN